MHKQKGGDQMASPTQDPRANKKDPLQQAFAANLQFIHKPSYQLAEIQRLFANAANQRCFVLGQADFPSGKVVVADPLVYLYHPHFAPPLQQAIPPGSYPVYLTVHASKLAGVRIIAAKLKISPAQAIRYEMAMPEGAATQHQDQRGVLAGFGVDAGLASFCDQQVAQEYDRFLAGWHAVHLEGNHYDDYFAALFAKSYAERPNFQRPGGDFIEWAVPDTGHRLCMFASGLGDGFYISHWGYDPQGAICELVIPFMDPLLFTA